MYSRDSLQVVRSAICRIISSVARKSVIMPSVDQSSALTRRREVLPTARCGYGSSTPNIQPDEFAYCSPGTFSTYHATDCPLALTHCPPTVQTCSLKDVRCTKYSRTTRDSPARSFANSSYILARRKRRISGAAGYGNRVSNGLERGPMGQQSGDLPSDLPQKRGHRLCPRRALGANGCNVSKRARRSILESHGR